MTTNTRKLVIARVLPIVSNINRENNNRIINIKVEKMANFDQMNDCFDNNISVNPKPKRKRQRLDHLSEEQKLKRRKLKNRVAAQTARDRKKVKVNELEEKVLNLSTQRNILKNSNEALILKYQELERENLELKKRLSQMNSHLTKDSENLSVIEKSDNSIESAELIHVSQPKNQELLTIDETLKFVHHSMTPLIYLLMIMNLMQSLNSCKNAQKNCWSRPSLKPIKRNNRSIQILPKTHLTLHQNSWSQFKT